MFGILKEWNRKKTEKFYETALAYYEGKEKVKDLKQAVANFREAAERGHTDACKALGWISLYEDGYPRSLPDAIRWFRKGAELGDVQCAYNLAVVYSNQPDVRDYEKAFLYFKQAAEAGDAESAFCCAQLLIGGVGTPQDEVAAEQWYVRAHEAGHPDAAEEIASILEERTIGLDPESENDCLKTAELLELAAQWHERAAEVASSEDLQEDRASRAQDCLRAADAYRRHAEDIARLIRETWMTAPEPPQAYCIVLAGDYDHGGRQMMERFLMWAREYFLCTEGSRRKYRFFWFEDQGQYVEVFCFYHLEEGMELIEGGLLPLNRLIPILPYDSGLTEQVRLCVERCLAGGLTSILPVTVAASAVDADDGELTALVERDLRSFAKGNGASGELPIVRAILEAPVEEAVWCEAVLNPEVSWWTEEVLKDSASGDEGDLTASNVL